jgi:hypothetical protein
MIVRRLALAVSLAAVCAHAQQAAARVEYHAHLTQILPGANDVCGPLKMFVVKVHLQRHHTFGTLHAFYLRLRNGTTIKIPYESFNLSTDRRTVTYYAHDVPLHAKVSSNLRLSHTRFTATPGSRWRVTVDKSCYTL